MNTSVANELASQYATETRRRRIYSVIIGAFVIWFLAQTFIIAEKMNSGSFATGMSQFFDYPVDIMRDTIEKRNLWVDLFKGYVPAMIETLHMAAIGTIVGAFGAIIFSFMATRGIQVWPPLIPVARRTMDIMRAFPELIIALFLIFVLGTSPIPAIIAIAIHTAGALGKLFSEVNENIDLGTVEGLQSTGANWFQRVRFGVLPQVAPNYLSYLLLRFEINVRASAILGFVGAGGIGTELRKAIGWSQGEQISALFVLLFITIVFIDQCSSYFRRRLIGSAAIQSNTI